MPRNYAQLAVRIWRDDDVTARSRDAQWLYMLLLSQPKLNAAGVITLSVKRWSRLAAGTSPAVVETALDELAEHRFVVVDDETEEVLVRSFIRNDGGWRNPNHWPSARGEALKTESKKLRSALAVELSRLPEDKRPKDVPSVVEALRDGIDPSTPDAMSDPIAYGMPDAIGDGMPDAHGVGGYVSLHVGAPSPTPPPTHAAATTRELLAHRPLQDTPPARELLQRIVGAQTHSTEQISAALDALARQNLPITPHTMRIELYGPAQPDSNGRRTDTPTTDKAVGWLELARDTAREAQANIRAIGGAP